MEKDNIIVTNLRDSLFVSKKYEKYTVEEVDGILTVIGRGRVVEDKFRGPDKEVLVSLMNLSDDLMAEAKRYKTINNGHDKKNFTCSRVPTIDGIIKHDHGALLNWMGHDEACQKLILSWCNKFGLPVEEAYPETGFELEPFLFQLFRLNKKINEWFNGNDGERQKEFKTIKYVMSGKLIYDIDIIDGEPKMTIILPSVLDLARLQLVLSMCNPSGDETVIQCQVCLRWFLGNPKKKYCGKPCNKMTAYRKRKKEEEANQGVKA